MISRMFPFYGSKMTVAHTYPKPKFETVVEPFAGSAAYASAYSERDVILSDADPVIAGLWRWLIEVSPDVIRALPVDVERVSDLDICQEAKHLIGFWINHASTAPRNSPSSWAKSAMRPNCYWGPVARELVARQVVKIRHWKVVHASYSTVADLEATWFVDPPYQGPPGRCYVHNKIDYDHLGAWCRTRRGQVIVCEQEGATWLPFKPHVKIATHASYAKKAKSSEVAWEGP